MSLLNINVQAHADITIQRFWSKVDKLGPIQKHMIVAGVDARLFRCWQWLGNTNHRGYGQLFVGKKAFFVRKNVSAHRFSYWISHKITLITDVDCVLHHCDFTSCVRPSHLYLGDYQQNANDRHVRNRQTRGEDVLNAKLTKKDVREMRAKHAADVRMVQIALEHNVSTTAAYNAVMGYSWREVG